ncbi:alpha/beta hydrolase [Bdellovibrio bacteriovorus]|uniref:alpha/beta fold hydrolase n=1 Tax=Bdellovibrio bacteriovorus TaxID=959 RepID=UPI0021D114E2|nr:alpha/beta hydrolase [Bdellovibrio bacteriovorus]UXR64211.1 alpha/beta hydrolase [Bdellovibrio bacteriovorus]
MSYLNNFYHHLYGPEDGRKWVFVHGLMGYGQNWRKIIQGLETTERCLAYDQRGHGRSFQPAEGYSPEDYADDLKMIVDELGWDQFVLVGHSMGGRNVLNFASRFPECVSKLVIEDIGPEANPQAHEYYEYLLNLVPAPFATREEAKRYFFEDFVKTAKTRENIQVMANYFYSNMTEQPNGTVDWRFSKNGIIDSVRLGRTDERWDEVKSLKMPTLLVRGANSKELSQENYDKMLTSNPMIKGVVIPGAGHWVHSDQPQAFTEALKMFVGGF